MLLETFWYQIFENRTKTELSRQYSLNYSCKCIPTFASPCISKSAVKNQYFYGNEEINCWFTPFSYNN